MGEYKVRYEFVRCGVCNHILEESHKRCDYCRLECEIDLLRDRIRGNEITISGLQISLGECRRLLREAVSRRLADMTIEWWDRASKEAKQAGGEDE